MGWSHTSYRWVEWAAPLFVLVLVVLFWSLPFLLRPESANGQASQGSPAFQEEQVQTRALERQARALEGIHTVLQRMDRRCR